VSYEKSPDLKNPSYEKFRNEVKGKIEKEEDIISYALFPEITLAFFEKRKNHVAKPKVEHKEIEKATTKEITKQQIDKQQPKSNGGFALKSPLPGAILKIIGETGKP